MAVYKRGLSWNEARPLRGRLGKLAALLASLVAAPVVHVREALREEYDLDPRAGEEEVETVVTEMMGKGLVRSLPA